MSGIAEFLTARLDEDEQIARSAAKETGGGRGIGHGEPVCWRVGGDDDVYLNGGYGSMLATGPYGSLGEELATHIARHDPARVLVEVAAKRAIVEMYVDQSEGGHAPEYALSRAVRYLAAAYASHPDYDESWRP